MLLFLLMLGGKSYPPAFYSLNILQLDGASSDFSQLPLLTMMLRNHAFVLSSSVLASCHFGLSPKNPCMRRRVHCRTGVVVVTLFSNPLAYYLSYCCALKPSLWNFTFLCLKSLPALRVWDGHV